jgi:hypothetical protein
MTVRELIEQLEDFDPELEVHLVYQPRYPMAARIDFAKEARNVFKRRNASPRAVYICADASGANGYAPGSVYRDDEDEDEDDE